MPKLLVSEASLRFLLEYYSRNKHMLPLICAFPKHVYNAPASRFFFFAAVRTKYFPNASGISEVVSLCSISGEDVETQPWADFCTPGCEGGGHSQHPCSQRAENLLGTLPMVNPIENEITLMFLLSHWCRCICRF